MAVDELILRSKYRFITRKLIEQKLLITTMESATSGQIASLITDTEGSSSVFKGAFVTYSNEAKIRCGVDSDIIKKYGVYSKETAEAMAAACQSFFSADIGIGITGTFGNVDPANNDSVPGIVYVCIKYKRTVYNETYKLPSDLSRLESKYFVALSIAEKLIDLLEK